MQNQIPVKSLADIDIQTVNKNELVDVSDFTFDYSIPQEQRAELIVRTVKNPYCFRVGEIGVKLEFPDDAPSLQETLTSFMIRKKSGL